MMRAPDASSVAVRRPDGSIIVRARGSRNLSKRYPILKSPGLRGVAVLVETMYDGISSLNFAAEQALPAETDAKGGPSAPVSSFALLATLVMGMAFGFFLFAIVPHFLTFAIGWLTGSEALEGGQSFWFHLVDGILKAGIFLGFVWSMSLAKDMRRVFEYHGAEHQAVHAWEAGLDLVPESMSRFPTAHARCGTAFMVTVIAISIVVFAIVFPFVPVLSDVKMLNQALYVLIKLPLILPIAGLSYELQRFASRRTDGLLGKVISAPGVLFQRITTQPPDRSQQEIAIVALRAALDPGRIGVVPGGTGEATATFDDFDAFLGNPGEPQPEAAS